MPIANIKTFTEAKQFTFHAGYNTMEIFEKLPQESYLIEFEFKDKLPFDNILDNGQNACSVIVEDDAGADMSSTMISHVEIVDDTKLRCKLALGTSERDYLTTFKGKTLPDALDIYGRILVQVRDRRIK